MTDVSHRPKKNLGQNFLIDENVIRKLVNALMLTPEDHVLEIGPGHGVITKHVVSKVRRFVAVELDRNLADKLRREFSGIDNFELIEQDFLKINLVTLFGDYSQWKVFGNIPYHLTSSIIFNLIEHRHQAKSLTLMIQKEVARRIQSQPNSKLYGILAIYSQLYADVKLLFEVSKNVFYPRPKVDSAVVQWNFLPQPRYYIEDESTLKRMLRAMFGQRRKVLRNSLKPFLQNADTFPVDLSKRPEQLTVEEIVRLSNYISTV
ncbi:ribosomal RNA small subunit methyltransferase A [candidate division KSB1 bacterium]|nr:ribosomal RNA small subunit methyltransferase A [candidate division KSB1 bacterium]